MMGFSIRLGMIAFLMTTSTAWAATASLALELAAIERVVATEAGGDELYFSVTEYSTQVHPRHYVIPAFPAHWLSDHLNKVQGVQLWERTLQPKEAVTVLISLIESDAPPWNVDDLIGTIKLKAKHEAGRIQTQWQIPNREHAERLSGREHSFVLSGDGGEYHIALGLSADQPISTE